MNNPSPNPDLRTHRFALCLSGGVALGTYMAGVLAQLYADITDLNRFGREHGAARDMLRIDILAGSSAGSVTGLILAQSIAFADSDDPVLRAMSEPANLEARMRGSWVDGLEIHNLLSPSDDPSVSLFTDASMDRVSQDALAFPSRTTSSAGLDRAIALWMTMTNLDGIPKSIGFRQGASTDQSPVTFYARNYRDYAPYFVCGSEARAVTIPTHLLGDVPSGPKTPREWWDACKADTTWEEVKEDAMTSGAFPMAFRTRSRPRDLTLYDDYVQLRDELISDGTIREGELPDRANFTCADGGLFNNQPIGKAIDASAYLNRLDPDRVNDPRTYLVIEPDPTSPQLVVDSLKGLEKQDGANGLPPTALLGKILGAYFNDALYQDFQNAADTNERILKVNMALWEMDRHVREKAGDNFDEEAYLEIRKAIIGASGIAHKFVVDLERIPASIPVPDRLAGDFMGHFGGFLSRECREFDFQVGKAEARKWLVGWLKPRLSNFGLASLPDFLLEPVADPNDVQADRAHTEWGDLPATERVVTLFEALNRLQFHVGRRAVRPLVAVAWSVVAVCAFAGVGLAALVGRTPAATPGWALVGAVLGAVMPAVVVGFMLSRSAQRK